MGCRTISDEVVKTNLANITQEQSFDKDITKILSQINYSVENGKNIYDQLNQLVKLSIKPLTNSVQSFTKVIDILQSTPSLDMWNKMNLSKVALRFIINNNQNYNISNYIKINGLIPYNLLRMQQIMIKFIKQDYNSIFIA
ncbi:Hypothetical_protein [Hexamita inflata]|uniref:Hypothetical_protein n=1 Tax=Hexamita inflata TaxID=28002 RepID=A0ABP1ISS3_9EUKA